MFAGVFEFEAGLRLVQERGAAMQDAADATPSGMVSILGLDRPKVEARSATKPRQGEVLEIANLLCPGNIVISGSQRRLPTSRRFGAGRRSDESGAAGRRRSFPHSDHEARRSNGWPRRWPTSRCHRPKIPVVSNVDAQPHDDPEEIRQLLIQQIVSPVRWEDSMRYLLDHRLRRVL